MQGWASVCIFICVAHARRIHCSSVILLCLPLRSLRPLRFKEVGVAFAFPVACCLWPITYNLPRVPACRGWPVAYGLRSSATTIALILLFSVSLCCKSAVAGLRGEICSLRQKFHC